MNVNQIDTEYLFLFPVSLSFSSSLSFSPFDLESTLLMYVIASQLSTFETRQIVHVGIE